VRESIHGTVTSGDDIAERRMAKMNVATCSEGMKASRAAIIFLSAAAKAPFPICGG
jgi:hypothetical protein